MLSKAEPANSDHLTEETELVGISGVTSTDTESDNYVSDGCKFIFSARSNR